MQQAAAVNVAREVLNEKTAQSQAALHDTVQNLKLAIGVLKSAPRGIEAEQALIADLEDWRAAVVQKEAELQQAIIDVPGWRPVGDGRARDKEYDRQRTLQQQLHLLRAGSRSVNFARTVLWEEVGSGRPATRDQPRRLISARVSGLKRSSWLRLGRGFENSSVTPAGKKRLTSVADAINPISRNTSSVSVWTKVYGSNARPPSRSVKPRAAGSPRS